MNRRPPSPPTSDRFRPGRWSTRTSAARQAIEQPNGSRGVSPGVLIAACLTGGLLTWAALASAQAAQRTVAGPADGAPTMRGPLQVVSPVDLHRYAGLWHEQARLPNRYQAKCAGPVTAEYLPRADGSLTVRNRCEREDGSFEEITGEARPVDVPGQPGAGRLKVRFAPDWLAWLPMVWADYWILRLDRDYEVALVGTPDRRYLWVLSRSPRLDPERLKAELDYARSLGFDTERVERTGRSG